MNASSILPKLNRMDAIVVGPGLGRNPTLWPLLQEIFNFVKNEKVPFVIDGDGLWFVSEHIEHFPRQMVTTVLTPNIVEFSRLCKSALGEEDVLNVKSSSQLQHLAAELSRKMDVTIYMKGEVDLVVTPNGEVSKCSTDSSLRRCGGQGDVTAGSLGLFLYWAKKNLGDDWTSAHHEAGISSSWLVRTAGRRAFEKHGRSMNTPLLLDEIPKLVRDVETREMKDTVHSDSSKH
ncbi:hypothetical protein L3Y34_002136 [Caenorhabditis briggsae]|nr:hypothetical protein L3Y34_002136 [Caenorhabditis briggsae]